MKKIAIIGVLTLIFCYSVNAQTATNKIEQTGHVGIGTITPAVKLEVSTDQDEVLDAITIGSTAYGYNGANISFKSAGSHVAGISGYYGSYGGMLKFKTLPYSGALVDAMTITGNGYVGIGTIAPAYKLDVNGSASVSGTALLGAATIGTNAAFTARAVFDPQGASGAFLKMTSLFTGTVMAIDVTDIYSQNGQPAVKISGNYTYANGPQLLIEGTHNNPYYKNKGIEINLTRNGQNAYAGQDKGLSLNVSSNDGSAFAIYSAAGRNYFEDNVSIGTNDSKGYKLAVNGDALFTKIKVKQFPWPDYVFSKSYQLTPLAEVEAYIQKHNHLPGIVSANEVEREGLDVGENQAALLTKIEELTLYVIKIEKQVKAQQKMLNKQSKRDEKKQRTFPPTRSKVG